MTERLEELLRRAYFYGFAQSAEGFNAEYPFDDDDAPQDDPLLNEAFENWLPTDQLRKAADSE